MVKKLTKDTNLPIAKVNVGLCDKDGNIAKDSNGKEKVYSTNDNGEIDFGSTNLLAPGKYYYKDISTIDGYRVDKQIHSFTVSENGSVTYSENKGIVYNDRVRVTIKEIEKGTNNPLQGIEIAICDKDGNILKTDVGKDKIFITNENGEINLGENEILAPGTYYYKETKTKDGYIKDENIYSFTIKENGEVEYSQKDGLHYKEKIVDKAEQNNSKNKDGKDNPSSLPNAGKGMLGLSILTLILSAGIGYVKYKKYKI